MPRFEIHSEAIIRRIYKVDAGDADFARMKVESGKITPKSSTTSEPNITQVTQIGPRYVVQRDIIVGFAVKDTKEDEYIASSKYEDVAKTIARTFNNEEEVK